MRIAELRFEQLQLVGDSIECREMEQEIQNMLECCSGNDAMCDSLISGTQGVTKAAE